VQLKARAASRWYGYANEHAKNNGNKLWFYLLVPHDAIVLGRTLANLKAELFIGLLKSEIFIITEAF